MYFAQCGQNCYNTMNRNDDSNFVFWFNKYHNSNNLFLFLYFLMLLLFYFSHHPREINVRVSERAFLSHKNFRCHFEFSLLLYPRTISRV